MNRLQIRTLARELIAEASTTLSYTTDTIFDDFLVDGLRDICIRGHVFEKTISITVATTVASYYLPWDFIAPSLLLNPAGVPLEKIDSTLVGRVYLTTGLPIYYDISSYDVTLAARGNLTAYVVWPATCLPTLTYLIPATANGYMYECTFAGTTAAAPPTYGLILGGTTADGTVIWTCRELIDSLYRLTLYDTPTTAGAGTGTYSLTYFAMDGGLPADTSAPNIPVDKHPALANYLCYRHFLRSKDLPLAGVFFQSYHQLAGIPMPQGGAQVAT